MTDYHEHLQDTPTIVFAFASGDMKRFEWGRTLRAAGVAHVLFRDSRSRWYLEGTEGLGDCVVDVAAYMDKVARNYDRALGLGLSGGSYGAIMHGVAAGLDEVLAISPVTGAGPALVAEISPALAHRVEQRSGDPILVDLAKLKYASTRIHCVVSNGDGTELDLHMANRIRPIQITHLPGHSHAGLGAHCRDIGLVREFAHGGL